MALMTYAEAAAHALAAEMADDPSVVALGEDLGRGGIFGQYRHLSARFGPSRIIDTPISEATIMGAAVGMALTGLKPVVELRVIDFALCATDEIINQAAKNRYMFGGQGRVPVVIRMPIGIWSASAAQHSQSLENWFIHVPGLVVLAPATPQDNHDLLRAAVQCPDPVVYLEHKELWGHSAEVDTRAAHARSVDWASLLGKAQCVRQGSDLTVVSWGKALHWVTEAADNLADHGISAEVIDLRTLWPWDRQAVFASASRTGRLLVVHEAIQTSGFGAEIVASVAESTDLRHVRVARLGGPRIPVGYAPELEARARISAEQVGQAMQNLFQS
jgi:pyruvate/2-oxoglutarate/acetoin dehydrogenase E1 component